MVSVRDLSGLGIDRVGAMTFAPTGDRTDDPSSTTLYVADRGSADPTAATGAVWELELTPTVALAVTPGLSATLVRTIRTGLQPPGGPWNPVQAGEPTSPDPSGLTYRPPHDGQTAGRIINVDGEVDEMSNYWSGANVYELTTGGDLTRWWDTSSRSGARITNEPTGAAWDEGRNRLYIDSDDDRRVYVFDPARGANPQEIERTDLERSFSVSFASDPEGLAYGADELFVCDGSSEEIWVLAPGPNGFFNGLPSNGGDDVWSATSIPPALARTTPRAASTARPPAPVHDQSQLEHRAGGHTGVRSFQRRPADAGRALPGADGGAQLDQPGTSRPSDADRAVDNDTNGNENDGKIYEIHLSGTPPPPTPSPSPSPSATATSGGTPTPTPSPSPSPSPTQSGGSIQRLATSTVVNAVASSQVVVATPAGTVSGDVLVACIALNGGSVSTPPAGWSLLGAATSQSNPKVYGYVRVAGATEPPTYTWTLAGSVANGAGIARYGGVSSAQPLDGAVSVGTGVAALSALRGVTTSTARIEAGRMHGRQRARPAS
jgi:hypothetical protein